MLLSSIEEFSWIKSAKIRRKAGTESCLAEAIGLVQRFNEEHRRYPILKDLSGADKAKIKDAGGIGNVLAKARES